MGIALNGCVFTPRKTRQQVKKWSTSPKFLIRKQCNSPMNTLNQSYTTVVYTVHVPQTLSSSPDKQNSLAAPIHCIFGLATARRLGLLSCQRQRQSERKRGHRWIRSLPLCWWQHQVQKRVKKKKIIGREGGRGWRWVRKGFTILFFSLWHSNIMNTNNYHFREIAMVVATRGSPYLGTGRSLLQRRNCHHYHDCGS